MVDKKHFDFERIIKNAQTLLIPEVYECFLYDCEDPDGFHEIEDEIEELAELLPQGIDILDLPNIYSGNRRTKVFGKASCSATNGHLILEQDGTGRQLFENAVEAIALSFRPCARCMPVEYAKWKHALTENN